MLYRKNAFNFIYQLTSEWTKEKKKSMFTKKSKSNEYLVWPPYAFETASILLGTFAQSQGF